MAHLSIAVILLSILAFAVGFIFGVVLFADNDYYIPRTNFDKYVQVNRDELISEIAFNYCINPKDFTHADRDCLGCPFKSEYVEGCVTSTEDWLRQPYINLKERT